MARRGNIKRPIQRSVVLGGLFLVLALVILLSLIAYAIISPMLYSRYDTKLSEVISYVEHNVDADDLANCIRTGEHSEKYDDLQQRLNLIVDDFGLEYLYIVIPTSDAMVNAISATSEAERAAGEEDMPLLERTDAYSSEELERYLSFWDADDIGYFQESSEYGTYYTACKPLRDSGGETVALMCADLSIDALQGNLMALFGGCLAVVLVLVGAFVGIALLWIRRNITTPLLALEKSAREFAEKSHDADGVTQLEFDMPDIHTGNEVESLALAIGKMEGDIRAYVDEVVAAQARATDAERESIRLAGEAEAAAKIAEFSQSVTSLLDNMPGLTFSKDAETGEYLACNQAFAEYARKSSPSDVVGLTDKEIFDAATAQHFADGDKKALAMDGPYVFFEDVLDAAGTPKQLRTTKMKFYEPSGRLCTLGVSMDVTDLVSARNDTAEARRAYEEAREESLTYYSIARALFTDYMQLYYVDLETGEFASYRNDGTSLLLDRKGDNFFDGDRKGVRHPVYGPDREAFRQAMTRERFASEVEEHGIYAISYRVVIDDVPTYMSMKASRIEGDDRHIVVGINNVDAQMKQQEAARRLQEEQATIARITALSGDYLAIFTVNPDTGRYEAYSVAENAREIVALQGGEDFFLDAVARCEEIAYREDFGMIQSLLVKERVVGEAREHGVFIANFRIMVDGSPRYVSMRAALVKEYDNLQLIVGVIDIDSQMKREMEFADARDKANRDALTGVKNKHAYKDAEQALDRRIASGEAVEFGIVVCDLNNLKVTNDTMGHLAGDELLKQASSIICDVFKHSPVFRIGGDEFAVVLQGKDFENVGKLTEMLADSNAVHALDGGAVVAWGFSAYQGDESTEDVFTRADAAMYENKRAIKREAGRRAT